MYEGSSFSIPRKLVCLEKNENEYNKNEFNENENENEFNENKNG